MAKATKKENKWPVWFMLSKGIEACATLSSSHYAATCLQVRPREGGVWLAATDGRQAIVKPCKGHADTVHLVPVHPLSAALDETGRVYLDGRWFSEKNGRYAEPIAGQKFPPISQVLPEIGDDCLPVTLDVHLLMKMAEAIAKKGVLTLFIPKEPLKPIAVIGADGIGAVMPQDSIDVPEHTPERYANTVKAFSEAPKT